MTTHRPTFEDWQLDFTLDYNETEIDEGTIRKLIEVVAGTHIGLGSMRPERHGPYGQFKIKEWTPHS
jgi:hypothetical protein